MTSHKESFSVQRLEVVNTGRRRRWTAEERLRIVEESFRGHRQVSATARRHDISPSLLYTWRKRFRAACRGEVGNAGASQRRGHEIGFASAVVVPDEIPQPHRSTISGRMEILTVTGHRIIVGADVDASSLARVIAALEARPFYATPQADGDKAELRSGEGR